MGFKWYKQLLMNILNPVLLLVLWSLIVASITIFLIIKTIKDEQK